MVLIIYCIQCLIDVQQLSKITGFVQDIGTETYLDNALVLANTVCTEMAMPLKMQQNNFSKA